MSNKRGGVIAPILRDFSNSPVLTAEKSLANNKMTRTPGTGVFKYPYKELSGKYRTGLDPDAAYIKRIKDESERSLEIEKVSTLKEKLEKAFDVDLGPHSKFWNYALSTHTDDNTHVRPVKLMDTDNFFDFADPFQELAFAWLRVHPTIASSHQAWERGEYPAETQFYVVDENVEAKAAFTKKKLINSAIVKFETMTPSKKKQVARQLGLPVTDDTREEEVYNLVDTVLKQTEFKTGAHRGLSPVKVFIQFAEMDNALLDVKDTIKQAIQYNIIRTREGGKIYRGEFKLADNEEGLVKFLMNIDNQQDFIALQEDLKTKKLVDV